MPAKVRQDHLPPHRRHRRRNPWLDPVLLSVREKPVDHQGRSPGAQDLIGDLLTVKARKPADVAHILPPPQNSPSIWPCASSRIFAAEGRRGKPGMVMTSPQIATTKPAPADSRTSRTGRT